MSKGAKNGSKADTKKDDIEKLFLAPSSEIGRFSPHQIGRGSKKGELGYTGLNQSYGWVFDDILRKLQGTNGQRIWREMADNDATIGSFLYAIDTVIRQADFNIKPFSDDQEDIDRAEFVQTCLHDMSSTWADTLSSILSFIPHGFSYHELVYKKRLGRGRRRGAVQSKYNDGLIGWKKIPVRDQVTLVNGGWEIDENGGIQGCWQWGPPLYKRVFIPIEKALLFRVRTNKNNPEGRSMIRNAYRAWWFKQNTENIEAIGIERDNAGLPVIYAPASIMATDASPADQAIYTYLKKVATNIRNDEQAGVVFPSDIDADGNSMYKLELLGSPGNKQFDTNEIIKRYQNEILQTVLADFLKLGQDKVGSFALSSDKTGLFIMSLDSLADQIESPFNDFAIPRLFKLNGWDEQRTPTLEHGPFKKTDINVIVEALSKLSGAGMELFPDPEMEAHFRRELGLPTKDDTEL